MAKQHHTLIIIGSGPAGLTAGIYASRAELKPLLIKGSTPGGQLMSTTDVENWPGHKKIMGPQLMIDMEEHAKSFGTQMLDESVESVKFDKKPFELTTDKGTELTADTVIIATGATPLRLKIDGEPELWGKGISTCAVCDGAFYKDKPIAIVGGGDTAMEMAAFMTRFTKNITVIQLGNELTASKAMQKPVLDNESINIIYNSGVTGVSETDGRLSSIEITDQNTKNTQNLAVEGLFVAIGLKPQTEFLKGQIELDSKGYLVLTDHTKTSVPGVFGAGDVADYRYRQAITSAGAGCMAALDAEKYLVYLDE